jgi:hypothetical protein
MTASNGRSRAPTIRTECTTGPARAQAASGAHALCRRCPPRCSAAGRCHDAGARRAAGFVDELLADDLVHPECSDAFRAVRAETLDLIGPLFDGSAACRIHGDCHRGTIIDRPGTGLALIDFDDMMSGPPGQGRGQSSGDRSSPGGRARGSTPGSASTSPSGAPRRSGSRRPRICGSRPRS